MSDEEAGAIFDTFSRMVSTEDQITEVDHRRCHWLTCKFLAALPSHLGGLAPVGAGLFHTSLQVRMSTVTLLQNMKACQVSQDIICRHARH